MNENATWMDFNDAVAQVQPPPLKIPAPDLDAIASYMDLVFDYCEGLIPFRAFADRGQALDARPHAIWVEADEMTKLASAKEKASTFGKWAAREGMAFYVIPGTVAEQGGAKASDIVQTQVILADLDAGDIEAKLEHLSIFMGEPTAVIESGGITQEGMAKLHVYWRLSEPAEGEDITLACSIRHQIALKTGGDIHFQSAHQPIRVAGSVYHKHGQPCLVSFRSKSNLEYHLRDMAEAVDDMPIMEGIDLSGLDFNNTETTKPLVQDVLTTPVHEGAQDLWTRFTGASSAIGHYIRMAHVGQMSRNEAWEAICQYNAAMLRPPWPQDRLAIESQRLWTKHCAKNGDPNRSNPESYAIASFSARSSLESPTPIPQDIISPRILTPAGMWIIAGPPKIGKSDLLLNLFTHASAGISFLGFDFPRPLRVFYAQAEIEKPYMDERVKRVIEKNRSILAPGLDRLVITDRFKFNFDETGINTVVGEIMRAFPAPDNPVDIVAVDPFRNVYQSGLSDGDINEDLLAFFTQRLERLLERVNPKAGLVIVHHTNKITGKMLAEDPMAAMSGGGAILSYPTALTVLGKSGTEEDPSITAWFDIRNGPPIPMMTIGKSHGQWVDLGSPDIRLVRQSWGELNDREQNRKRRSTLEFIFEEARWSRLYTASSLSKVLAGRYGLGSEATIRRNIAVCELKGFIRFINGEAIQQYGLTRPRSPIGYLCVEGMAREKTVDENTGEIIPTLEYLPTHYRDDQSEQVFELKKEDVRKWCYLNIDDEDDDPS